MKYKKSLLFAISLLFFSLAFLSCDTDDNCRKERFVSVSVDFKKAVIDSLGIQTLSTFSVDSVDLWGIDNDSLILNNQKRSSSAKLYLNKFEEESRFHISFNDTIDTITIRHRNTEEFLSFQCGCVVTHVIDTVLITGHFIDSIAVKNNEVNTLTNNATNFELYRHYNRYSGK